MRSRFHAVLEPGEVDVFGGGQAEGSTWTKVGVGEGPREGGWWEEREGALEETGIRFELSAGKDMAEEEAAVGGDAGRPRARPRECYSDSDLLASLDGRFARVQLLLLVVVGVQDELTELASRVGWGGLTRPVRFTMRSEVTNALEMETKEPELERQYQLIVSERGVPKGRDS